MKRKSRFKITDDTLTSVVIYSLLFCAIITIVGLVLGAFGHDVSSIVDSTHRVFGTELSNEYSGLISFRMVWLDLLAVQGTLKSLLQHHSSKASILPCSALL